MTTVSFPCCFRCTHIFHELLNVPDIRDTVNYKEVMKQYGLGPNGAIVTSLNLFATKFDKVISLLEKASSTHEVAVIDTPGQIEVFTWSASGNIVTEALASTFPTVVVYVMDTIRSVNPVTFMSNMLYACSILYKTKLPFIVAMNKVGLRLYGIYDHVLLVLMLLVKVTFNQDWSTQLLWHPGYRLDVQ